MLLLWLSFPILVTMLYLVAWKSVFPQSSALIFYLLLPSWEYEIGRRLKKFHYYLLAPFHFKCWMNTFEGSNHCDVGLYIFFSCWIDAPNGSKYSEGAHTYFHLTLWTHLKALSTGKWAHTSSSLAGWIHLKAPSTVKWACTSSLLAGWTHLKAALYRLHCPKGISGYRAVKKLAILKGEEPFAFLP